MKEAFIKVSSKVSRRILFFFRLMSRRCTIAREDTERGVESSMEYDLKVGIEGREETVVGEGDLATAVGSGTVGVYATPSLAALMEKASWKLVQQYLPGGHTTVGTELSVTHLKATPPGMRVSCRARLSNSPRPSALAGQSLESDKRTMIFLKLVARESFITLPPRRQTHLTGEARSILFR